MRRKRGAWMNSASDPVLECLDELDTAVPVSVLDIELESSRSTVSRAVDDLLDRGMIERHPDYNTHYRITEVGRAYLAGEVDASDLEPGQDTDD